MSAQKFLDLLESQHLLDDAIIADLRRQVSESTRAVNAETIAKLLVDNGHLTKFQATKLVGDLGADKGASQSASQKKRSKKRSATRQEEAPAPAPEQELGLAEDEDLLQDGASPTGEGLTPLDGDAPAAADSPQPLGSGGLQPLDGGGLQPLDSGGGLQPLDGGGGLQPLDSSGGLQPLDSGAGLQPLGGGGAASLDPMDAQDPVAAAAETEEKKERKGPKKIRNRENIWDSPLLLVGSGLLLLLLFAGVMLWLSLTRGTADDFFAKAEEDYRGGSYTQAMDKYQKFLEKFPSNPNVSLARVRIGMAQLRTSVEHGSDPQKALDTAKEVLPTIVAEENFNEARPELTTLLPEIASKFAERADNAQSIDQAEQLLTKVDEAMKLIFEGSYITTSDRKTVQATLDDIVELKEKVSREIFRDRSLAQTVKEIREAIAADDTSEAYAARKKLLQSYPGLDTAPSLVSVVDEITERARGLVGHQPPEFEVATEDFAAADTIRVLLAGNGGRPLAGADNYLGLAKVDGVVYGVDAASGRVRWHRFVGYDTEIQPQPTSADAGADALVGDGERHELLRLKAEDGSVVWRVPLGEPFNQPTISDDEARVIVSTRSGRVMELDTATGACTLTARIPQELTVGPGRGDARRPMIYQVADHDNLYVISNDSLECQQVYHLGHLAGTVEVPPVMEVGLVFVAVNSRPGVCMLHVLDANEKGQELVEAQPPIPLEGHVISPLIVTKRQIIVITDLGQVNVFDIAPQKEDQAPVSAAVSPGVATHRQPTRSYAVAGDLRLWVGDTRLTHYEIQTAKGELVKAEITNQGDAFVGPMRHIAGGLIHLRKPQGSPGVTMRAVNDRAIEETIWFTELGVPAARVVVDGTKIQAVSGRGRVYPISSDAVSQGFAKPIVPPEGDDVGHYFQHSGQLASGEFMFFNQNLDVLVLQPGTGQTAMRRMPGARGQVAAVPQPMGAGLVVPLDSGQVMLVGANGQPLAHPFQPKLEAGGRVDWRQPAAVAEDKFVIADGRQSLYLVGINTRGAVHLGMIQQQGLKDDIVTPLAATGNVVWGGTRGPGGDELVSFAADSLKPGKTVELKGRTTFGPVAVGDDLMVATTGDGLLCLTPEGERRWSLAVPSPLAGAPTRDGDAYLLATVDGLLLRVDGATGNLQQRKQLHEPLRSAAQSLGPRVVVSGADGTLLVATLEDASSGGAAPPETSGSPEAADTAATTSRSD